jgi:hypothetical protein
MATLRAAKRRRLPKGSFGLPGRRAYPMDTPRRAANAKGRATQMAKRGKLSASAKARIHAKANRVLKRSGGVKRGKSRAAPKRRRR